MIKEVIVTATVSIVVLSPSKMFTIQVVHAKSRCVSII